MRHLVFVYGTLLAGESNHRCLAGADFIGEATLQTEGWKMVSLSAFPALVPGKSKAPIRGEVYRVTDEGLARLDQLEGYRPDGKHNLYDRITVATSVGEAIIYVMPKSRSGRSLPEITAGSWREWQKEQRQ